MNWRRSTPTVVLALVGGLASGGCVAAAPLISAAISAAPLIGGRSVERTVGADRQTAWQAVETTLADLAFRIEGREQEKDEWRLRGVADDVTVEAKLEPVTSRLTRVSVRVETGGPLADRRTAEVIHDHIVKIVHAAGRPTTVTDSASSRSDEAIRSLETEVRRLRTDIDDRSRSTRQPVESSTPNQPPAVRVERSAIVTAPLSAALPSVAGAAPPISVIQPAGIITPAAEGVPMVKRPMVPGAADTSSMTDRVGPARPAEALVPVAPVSQSRSGS
jgi:Protein of unknown function (DUF3568)